MLDAIKDLTAKFTMSRIASENRGGEQKQQIATKIDIQSSNLLSNISQELINFNKDLSDSTMLHAVNVVGSELDDILGEVKKDSNYLDQEHMGALINSVKTTENKLKKDFDMSFFTPTANAKLQSVFNEKISQINNAINVKISNTNRDSAKNFLDPNVNTMSLDSFAKAVDDKVIGGNLRNFMGDNAFAVGVQNAYKHKLDATLKNPENSIKDKMAWIDSATKRGFISDDYAGSLRATTMSNEVVDKITLSPVLTAQKAPEVFKLIENDYSKPLNNLVSDVTNLRTVLGNGGTPEQKATLLAKEHLLEIRANASKKNSQDALLRQGAIAFSIDPSYSEIAQNLITSFKMNGGNFVIPLSNIQKDAYAGKTTVVFDKFLKSQHSLAKTSTLKNGWLDLDSITSGMENSQDSSQKALWNLTAGYRKGAYNTMGIDENDISAYYDIKDTTAVNNSIDRFLQFVASTDTDLIGTEFFKNRNSSYTRDTVGLFLAKNGLLITSKDQYTSDDLEKFKSNFADFGGQKILGANEEVIARILGNEDIAKNDTAFWWFNNTYQVTNGKLTWLPSGRYMFTFSGNSSKKAILFNENGVQTGEIKRRN